MTQVVASLLSEGIVVATDSRAVQYGPYGPEGTLTIRKLFPLGRKEDAFVLTAGSGMGLPLCIRLQRYLMQCGARGFEEILDLAEPFLERHYAEMLKQSPLPSGQERLLRLYFLLGGRTACPEGGRIFRMTLLASEGGRLPFEKHPVLHCLTIPRSLGTEMRLHRMGSEGASLMEILHAARDFLEHRAHEDEDVGPPFFWGVLTRKGLRLGSWGPTNPETTPTEQGE